MTAYLCLFDFLPRAPSIRKAHYPQLRYQQRSVWVFSLWMFVNLYWLLSGCCIMFVANVIMINWCPAGLVGEVPSLGQSQNRRQLELCLRLVHKYLNFKICSRRKPFLPVKRLGKGHSNLYAGHALSMKYPTYTLCTENDNLVTNKSWARQSFWAYKQMHSRSMCMVPCICWDVVNEEPDFNYLHCHTLTDTINVLKVYTVN